MSFSIISRSQIVVNEMMSNNQAVLQDADGDYSDWIELYNAGNSPVDLSGYSLTDNPDTLNKWTFPHVLINSHAYLLVWCSGKNRTASPFHTNFSLSSAGCEILFSDPSQNILDDIVIPALSANVSYGRYPDGNASSYILSSASPSTSNNSSLPYFGVVSDAPVFSIPGGFYTAQQSLTLSHPDPQVLIRYTTDGSEPNESSPIYLFPISIHSRAGDANVYSMIRTCYNVHAWLPDWYPPVGEVFKANVIRARAYKANCLPGPIVTNTYFVDPNMYSRYGNLPVVSIVSDPHNLFNDTTGIYVPGINYQPGTFHANYYKAWNRPANIEMYVPGGALAFNGNFEINVNGQSSPSSPQKGLNVNASIDYGPSKIEYPLFENTPGSARYIQKFDKVKFRAWGSDRARGLFRDAYCHSFFTKSDLDIEAYQPVVVFIDGEYWGLQELRERNRNGDYFQEHYLIDSKNPGVDILNGAGNDIIEGDAVEWNALSSFLYANDMSIPSNYAYVKSKVDIHSFIMDYMASIYFSRADWPDQNEAKWRPRLANGKWRWIMWDMDNTAAFYLTPWYNMFSQVLTGNRGYGPSDILNQLLQSDEFKADFINLFADYMNTEFLPPLVRTRVDEMKAELDPYMNEYVNRWQVNSNWNNQTDSMKWWMGLRPSFCRQHIMSAFNIPSTVNIQLDVNDTLKGEIKINTVLLDNTTARTTANTYPWNGDYFAGVPVPLHAIARPGYHFVKWLPSNSTNPDIVLNLSNDTSLIAVFDQNVPFVPYTAPVINEAMASNSSTVTDNYGEYDDWIEIYNPGNDTIDLAGYSLTDHLTVPQLSIIPSGNDSTKIPPHGHLLFWPDENPSQGVLHVNFKLNTQFNQIALIAPDGNSIVDSVRVMNSITDVSYGRRSDGSPHWTSFPVSTPYDVNWKNGGRIFINELCTNNQTILSDQAGEYDQWVELYNPNSDTVDVGSWVLSDQQSGYSILTPGTDYTILPPYGFNLFWADGTPVQGINHLTFSLGTSGGCLELLRPDAHSEDQICYSSIPADSSFGRSSDGNPSWELFSGPTPVSSNTGAPTSIHEIHPTGSLYAYPNPVTEGEIFVNKPISYLIEDAIGRCILRGKTTYSIPLPGLKQGFYVLKTTDGEALKFIVQ